MLVLSVSGSGSDTQVTTHLLLLLSVLVLPWRLGSVVIGHWLVLVLSVSASVSASVSVRVRMTMRG